MIDINSYLQSLPAEQRTELERIRVLARRIAPADAEEAISYGIPSLRYKGKPLFGYAAHSDHIGIYPFSPPAIEALKDQLGDYQLSKGTIRYSLGAPIRDTIVQQLIELRQKEISK